MALMSGNDCHLQLMVLICCKWFEWLRMDENGNIWPELLQFAENGWNEWKLMEMVGMAENC